MYTAYWDPNGKVWTIGPGITGPEIRKGTVWMKARCDAALEQKLAEARAQLLALSPGVAWPPGGEDSLTDFVYNVGSGHYEHSDVRKCALAGDWPGVEAHLLDWESAGGKRLGGLVTRREDEAAMIQTPGAVQSGPERGVAGSDGLPRSRMSDPSNSTARSLLPVKTTLPHVVSYVVAGLVGLASLSPTVAAIAASVPVVGPYVVPAVAFAGALVAFLHSVIPSAVPAPAVTTAVAQKKQAGFARVGMLVCIATALLTIAACASVTSFFNSPTGATTIAAAVDVAVATAESKGVSAAEINKIAHAALAADSSTSATFATVAAAVNAAVAKANLPAGDQAAIEIVEVAVSAAIQQKLNGNPSIAAAQAAVADVLKPLIAATGG